MVATLLFNRLNRSFYLFYIILAAVLICDQLSKSVVRHYQPNINIIPKILSLTYTTNTGASFGILQNMNTILLLISIAVIIGMFIHVYNHPDKKTLHFFALITAGALGNSIDRILYGAVTDFINFHFWPTFNIADSAITIGVIGLLIINWNSKNPTKTL
ncbi:MAG TPA: signal peptidase II [Candidatus Nanoarchaeia archaeon]|nr:signal peptidase II [Candidatus Nanoarchaeia archaeon]